MPKILLNMWSIPRKIFLLFLFSYFLLYTTTTLYSISFLTNPIWHKAIPWFGSLFGFEIKVFPNGSGDTTFNYFQNLFFLLLSLAVAVIVGVIDRNRADYKQLSKCLLILLRYYLAAQLINYGLAKLYYLQFREPSEMQLAKTLGDMSPMNLMWTFMGYSKAYTMFAGAMEFVAGLLLLTRRTRLLGALLTLGVMTNVMVLNYCYDVPVKLLTSHMVLMSIILILPDFKRLYRFFLSNNIPEPADNSGIIPEQFQKGKTIVKWILVSSFIGYVTYTSQHYANLTYNSDRPIFYGEYEVEKFQQFTDSAEVAPSTSEQWKTIYQNRAGSFILVRKDDTRIRQTLENDLEAKKLVFSGLDETLTHELHYQSLDSNRFELHGKMGLDSLSMTIQKRDKKRYRLINRDFHWISEYPFNR